jgi:hypothetical protein
VQRGALGVPGGTVEQELMKPHLIMRSDWGGRNLALKRRSCDGGFASA